MKNFPQSFEPVGSDSILEQFIQLKNYVNNALSMIEDNVNEILDSNDFVQTKVQNLTNEQKAQARENIGAGATTINVVDNLDSTSSVDALSANQGHVLQGLFYQLNTKIEENTETIDEHTVNISSLNQQSARALKTPISTPADTIVVGVDDNGDQINLQVGNGLFIANGILGTEHPVNSYYFCKTGSNSPASIFGGTWTRVATNVVMPLGNIAPVLSDNSDISYLSLVKMYNNNGSVPERYRDVATSDNGKLMFTNQGANGNGVGDLYWNLRTDLANSTNAISGVDVWFRES